MTKGRERAWDGKVGYLGVDWIELHMVAAIGKLFTQNRTSRQGRQCVGKTMAMSLRSLLG